MVAWCHIGGGRVSATIMPTLGGRRPHCNVFSSIRLRARLWHCGTNKLYASFPQERFYTIRPTFYRGGNGILLCFDVSNRSSFEKVEEVFIPEIRKVSQELPIILIGCKAGLWHDLLLVNRTSGVVVLGWGLTPSLISLLAIFSIV